MDFQRRQADDAAAVTAAEAQRDRDEKRRRQRAAKQDADAANNLARPARILTGVVDADHLDVSDSGAKVGLEEDFATALMGGREPAPHALAPPLHEREH